MLVSLPVKVPTELVVRLEEVLRGLLAHQVRGLPLALKGEGLELRLRLTLPNLLREVLDRGVTAVEKLGDVELMTLILRKGVVRGRPRNAKRAA